MKVLHTIPYFNKASGGPVSCTYQLVKGLVDEGCDTTILSFKPLDTDMIAKDDFISYLEDDRKTPMWISSNFIKELNLTINEYDIVHVNTIWTWPSHIPIPITKKHNKPIIISPHGMLYPQALAVSAWKKKIIGNLFVRRDLNMADCIHATSEEEVKHIRSYGINRPVAVIPNCICVEEFPTPRTIPNTIRKFGFVGRLNPIKNIDLLIEAWSSLGDKTQNCQLVIIGDGEKSYVDYLRRLAKEHIIENIVFRGFLSGDELKEAVRDLDYLVLPSKSENFGMVVAEALLCGVPVIASKGTPWQLLKEKHCGWWINTDKLSLSEAIDNALTLSEDTRLAMGLSGHNLIVERFSSHAIAKKMVLLYQWLLGKGSKPDFVYEN